MATVINVTVPPPEPILITLTGGPASALLLDITTPAGQPITLQLSPPAASPVTIEIAAAPPGADGPAGTSVTPVVLTLAAYLALSAPEQLDATKWYVIPKTS